MQTTKLSMQGYQVNFVFETVQ